MENLAHILLFKTNIVTIADKETLGKVLNAAGVYNWHIDCEDCDRILRIVSDSIQHKTIIQLIVNHGYECTELML